MRLRQPKLPEGTWDVTAWDAPISFEWTQKEPGMTSVAGHWVDAIGDGRARLTLTLDIRGLLIPIGALFYRGLTNRHMDFEAQGMKRAAEETQPQLLGDVFTRPRLDPATGCCGGPCCWDQHSCRWPADKPGGLTQSRPK